MLFENRQDTVVETPLGDLALHVGVLVLDHAGHEGDFRVHEVADAVFGTAHEELHQLKFGQAHVLDGVGGEEAVLNVEEGSLGFLGHAAADEGEISGLLGVAGVEHTPAAIGNADDVVMAGVDVEGLRGESARADVEDNGQAFAGDGVEDLFHKDEALAGGEIGNPAAGDSKAFAGGGGAMFGFRFDECQLVAPEVAFSVGYLDLVASTHGGGRCDGVGAGSLGDMGFHPDHGAGAVGSGWYSRKLRF